MRFPAGSIESAVRTEVERICVSRGGPQIVSEPPNAVVGGGGRVIESKGSVVVTGVALLKVGVVEHEDIAVRPVGGVLDEPFVARR